MAVSPLLVPVSALSLLLFRDAAKIPADDAYTQMVISQASNAVRDAARQPGWVRLEDAGDELGPGQSEVAPTAQDIVAQLAMRVWTNPRNLERRTSGPVSETFRDSGVYGLELTAAEAERLKGLRPGGGGGLWVQPLDYGEEETPVLVPSMTSYGVTDLGPTYLGMSSQFPYNLDEE